MMMEDETVQPALVGQVQRPVVQPVPERTGMGTHQSAAMKNDEWLTPPDLYAQLDAEFHFDFDPCPYPKPADFDGLTCEWGQRSSVWRFTPYLPCSLFGLPSRL